MKIMTLTALKNVKMVFELIPHPDQQFRCHCCSDTVQTVNSFSDLFINLQKKKILICVRRDLLESMECAYLFHSTTLKSGTAVQFDDMKEEGKCCHSAT
jgi:hypothetical protein